MEPQKPPLTTEVRGPVTYVQGLGLKVTGADSHRFTNPRITRDQRSYLAEAHRKLWFRGVGRVFSINPVTRMFVCLKAWACRVLNCKSSQDVELSPWFPWHQMQDFPDMGKRGIYVIAQFDCPPTVTPSHLLSNVIYVGETYGEGASLRKRLRLFHTAAQRGKAKHAGGIPGCFCRVCRHCDTALPRWF